MTQTVRATVVGISGPLPPVLCLVLLLAAGLRADVYEEIRVTRRNLVTTTYKWSHQGSLRLSQTGNSRNRNIFIWNEEHNTAYELDPATHQYLEPPKGDLISSFAKWIARSNIGQSGKIVNVYYETVDTGQRRQMLGKTARHLRFRERRVAAPGACDPSSSIESDGWYIDFKEREPGSIVMIAAKPVYNHYEPGEAHPCRDTVIKNGNQPYPGLLVFQEKDGSTLEVVALSAAPLDKSLFEAPSNYRKVDRLKSGRTLTWPERLSWDWNQLVDSISTWF